MAGVAADPVVELGLVRNPSPLVHAILALVLLIAATALAVYKPFGLTPYGARLHQRQRSGTAYISCATDGETTGASARNPQTSAWNYAFWIIALALLILVIASHLIGSVHPRH
jgi:hypothetical protein